MAAELQAMEDEQNAEASVEQHYGNGERSSELAMKLK